MGVMSRMQQLRQAQPITRRQLTEQRYVRQCTFHQPLLVHPPQGRSEPWQRIQRGAQAAQGDLEQITGALDQGDHLRKEIAKEWPFTATVTCGQYAHRRLTPFPVAQAQVEGAGQHEVEKPLVPTLTKHRCTGGVGAKDAEIEQAPKLVDRRTLEAGESAEETDSLLTALSLTGCPYLGIL